MRLLIAAAIALGACNKRSERPPPAPLVEQRDASVAVVAPPEVSPLDIAPIDVTSRRGARVPLDIAPEAPANLPPTCAQYRRMIIQLAQCETIGKGVQDAFVAGFKAMEEAFANLGSASPEVLKPLEGSCQQGIDALTQAAEVLCPRVVQVERE